MRTSTAPPLVLPRFRAAAPAGFELVEVLPGAALVPGLVAFAPVVAGVVPAGEELVGAPIVSAPVVVVVVDPDVGVTNSGGFASGTVPLSRPLAVVVVTVSAVPVPLTAVPVPTVPGVPVPAAGALPPGIPLTVAPAIGITRPSIVKI